MTLTRQQIEEALVRLVAPADAHQFRLWLASLPIDLLRLEYHRVMEKMSVENMH